MPIYPRDKFLYHAPIRKRWLALDPGSKTIGLALGDYQTEISTPLHTIQRKKFTKDMQELEKWIKDYEIGAIIVGLPLNMDGTEGTRCQSVRDFTAELNRYFNDAYPICFNDERLSTFEAESFLINEIDMGRSRRKEVIDKMAAQKIMSSALHRFVHNA